MALQPQNPEDFHAARAQRAQELFKTVHDRILQAHSRNAERQTTRQATLCKGGRTLAVGAFAYLLTNNLEGEKKCVPDEQAVPDEEALQGTQTQK
jgi:hypothetical protein